MWVTNWAKNLRRTKREYVTTCKSISGKGFVTILLQRQNKTTRLHIETMELRLTHHEAKIVIDKLQEILNDTGN